MFSPRRIESEILLALYRYSLFTTDQLATLLHYERKTIYKAFHTLKEKDWVQSLPLSFVERNLKGWTLSKSGVEVEFGLTNEYRPRLLKQTSVLSGQTAHLYRSNRYFTDLIACSLDSPADEGTHSGGVSPRSTACPIRFVDRNRIASVGGTGAVLARH